MSTLFWLSILLCLVVGAAIDTSNICLVLGVRNLLARKPAMIVGILLVTTCAAVVFYGNTLFGLHHRTLEWAYPNGATVAGAALFAAGSVLNGACAVGTVRRLARGDIGHLATFVGAFGVAWLLPGGEMLRQARNLPVMSGLAWVLVVLGFTAAVMVLARGHLREARLGSYALLGVGGALITDWQGNWTWFGVFQRLQAGLRIEPAAWACIAAMVLGAALTAIYTGRFKLKRPEPWTMLREFVGGGLMIGGAILIPGANDALSVYGVPSGSPNAVVGYLLMFAFLLVILRVKQHWASPQPALEMRPSSG